MDDAIRVECPAKLNTFLSVGPPDARGYHPIRTVFQAVEGGDVLTVRSAERFAFECDSAEVPLENTVTRAYRLAAEVVELPPIHVRLAKRIPTQSGLGGGSSNAAAMLRICVRLSEGNLRAHELADIALAIGADVPFFLLGGRAVGEGYGERLTALREAEGWATIVMPHGVRCDTKAMYAALDETDRTWRELNVDETYNDFERVAPRPCLELIEKLRSAGARSAGLSGSGAAVFALSASRAEAERLAEAVRFSGESGVAKLLTAQESLPPIRASRYTELP